MSNSNESNYNEWNDSDYNYYKKSPHRKSTDRYSRTRSRSRSRSRSSRRYSKYSRKRSPIRPRSSRDNQNWDRFNPPRNDILAVFGLDRDATENDLYHFYKKYDCKYCKVIFDKRTGKPRGFGFVYFNSVEDASRAKHGTNGKKLLSRDVRVDYSIGEKDSARFSSRYY